MKFLLAAAASLAVAHAQSDLSGCVNPSPLRRYPMTNWDRRLVRSAEEVHFDHTPDIQGTKEKWDVAYSKATDYLQRFNLTQKVRCFLRLLGSFKHSSGRIGNWFVLPVREDTCPLKYFLRCWLDQWTLRRQHPGRMY
jgi:hypothetical protein